MSSVVWLLVGASIVTWALSAVLTRHLRAGMPLMLDLWIAAGLLGLAADATWMKLLTVATLIAIRKVVTHALAAS